MKSFTQIQPAKLNENTIKLIGNDWTLVTSGVLPKTPDEHHTWNTMTASWGGMGFLWNKNVAFVFVRPQRYTFEFTQKFDKLTLSFFPETYRRALEFCGTKSGRDYDKAAETGLTAVQTPNGSVAFEQARIILDCTKLYADDIRAERFIDTKVISQQYPKHDFHRMYVCEINGVWVKEAKIS